MAKAIDERDFAKAMSLRDPEFAETYQNFLMISKLNTHTVPDRSSKVWLFSDIQNVLKAEVFETGSSYCYYPVRIFRMSVSCQSHTFYSVGAPAGGMNAATRTVVRFCVNAGHTPLAIHNGFKGLLDDHVAPLSWLEVDNWMTRGGSELGTNRSLPNEDLGAVASRLQEHKIDGLLLIGGFEAFNSLLILDKGRDLYPSLNIPMVHLPATISNNVPLTEFSLGSDTSLNALLDACDVIKQSASASRNRVFVVETQGGLCGYIATMGALAVSSPTDFCCFVRQHCRTTDRGGNRVYP